MAKKLPRGFWKFCPGAEIWRFFKVRQASTGQYTRILYEESSDGPRYKIFCLGWVGSAIFGVGLGLKNFP